MVSYNVRLPNTGNDPRTFPVMRSAYNWTVDHFVGKLSAIGQPTRPTQPLILPGPCNNWVTEVTVGLASHWPCVTDNSVYPPTGSMAYVRNMSKPPTLFWGHDPHLPFNSILVYTAACITAHFHYITDCEKYDTA